MGHLVRVQVTWAIPEAQRRLSQRDYTPGGTIIEAVQIYRAIKINRKQTHEADRTVIGFSGSLRINLLRISHTLRFEGDIRGSAPSAHGRLRHRPRANGHWIFAAGSALENLGA
jgi:hypothetical protein